jgi:hypothetical protein
MNASWFLLQGMPAASRQAFLHEAYSPEGLNLNLGSCRIGPATTRAVSIAMTMFLTI